MSNTRSEGPDTRNRWPHAVVFLIAALTLPAYIPLAAQNPSPSATPSQPVRGSISGIVTDADGAEVPGARVTLSSADGSSSQETFTDPDGRFTLSNVVAGPFKLTVVSAGFESTSTSGTLHQGEFLAIPSVVIAVATATSDVQVTLSKEDLAEAEIHVEEHQRLVGFVPNFYVTYDWHAAPLHSRQKFQLAWKTILDPASIIINAGVAGVEQATNALPGYGQGAQGYAKRLGAVNADFAIGTLIGGAILPTVFRQDPRYFYKGTGTVRSRILYSLSTAFICRGDNGRWQPNYSGIIGDFAAGAASNLYYPASDRNGAKITLYNGLISAGSDGVGNLVQEFVFKLFTPHAPTYPHP